MKKIILFIIFVVLVTTKTIFTIFSEKPLPIITVEDATYKPMTHDSKTAFSCQIYEYQQQPATSEQQYIALIVTKEKANNQLATSLGITVKKKIENGGAETWEPVRIKYVTFGSDNYDLSKVGGIPSDDDSVYRITKNGTLAAVLQEAFMTGKFRLRYRVNERFRPTLFQINTPVPMQASSEFNQCVRRLGGTYAN